MGASFIGQQFMRNVLGYSTFDAGLAILPAALFMVLVAAPSPRLVHACGSRATLLAGYLRKDDEQQLLGEYHQADSTQVKASPTARVRGQSSPAG